MSVLFTATAVPQAARPPRPPETPGELPAAVLVLAQRGDVKAQRTFVLTYQNRIVRFCARMVGPHHAEDLAQDTFLKALAALPQFDPAGPAKLSTWMLTIATRRCIDRLRSDKRFERAVDGHLGLLLPDAPEGAEPAALERALRQRIEAAIAELPHDLRATFVLRVTAECSVSETARVLAVDEGTVKSRLSRARQRLREAIGEV